MKAYLVNESEDTIVWSVVGHRNEFNKTMYNLAKKQVDLKCNLKLEDTRMISEKQRNFIWAMIGEICLQDYADRDFYKDHKYMKLKLMFINANELKEFSTSNCSMSMANRFINYIIGYMLLEDYQVHEWIVDFDHKLNQQHMYIMLIKGMCFVTGKTIGIHLHHYDRLGSGADRTKWEYHVGKRVMLLYAVEHELEHSQYEYMLNKHYINVKDLPVIDKQLAKTIANGTYKQALERIYNNVK